MAKESYVRASLRLLPLIVLLLILGGGVVNTTAAPALVAGVFTVPSSVNIDGTLYIRVTDADDPAAFSVTVRNTSSTCVPAGCKDEVVALTRTAATIYEGTLTNLSSAAVLSAQVNHVLVVDYNDANPATTITSPNITVRANTSGSISVPGNTPINQTLVVTVVDSDVNVNPLVADTIPAGVVTAIVSGSAGTPQNIGTLTETAANSGIFTNNTAPSTPFDMTPLGVMGGQQVIVTYNDAAPTTNKPTAVTTVTSTAGTLSVPGSIPGGGTLVATVTDGDANRNNAALDTVTISITKNGCPACTIVNVTLTETGNTTGIFNNAAAPFNPQTTLGLVVGDQMLVTYLDSDPTTNRPTAVVTISGTSGSISAPTTAAINAEIIITVTDADANTSGAADTVMVTLVKNGCGACTPLNITLTETTTTSGIFRNAPGSLFPFNVSSVMGGDQILATYLDASPTTNRPTALITITSTNGTITAPSTVLIGTNLTVTVTDADANRNAAGIDTVTVKIQEDNCPACTVATHTLNESGNNTGIFNAPAFDYATVLGLGDGDVMRVTYEDTDPIANKPFALVSIFSTSGKLLVANKVSLNTPLQVMVQDPELNVNPNAQETIVGLVVASCTLGGCGAPQSIGTLTETGNNTGIFFLSWNYGTLPGLTPALGEMFTLTYNDANPAANMPAVTITIVQGANATLTVNPTFVPADSAVIVTLFDLDLVNAGTQTVTVQNITTNQPPVAFNFTLTESVPEPGTFSAILQVYINGLNPKEGDTVRVRYLDQTPAGGGTPIAYTADIYIGNPPVPIFGSDAVLSVTPSTIPGRAINVSLTDSDLGSASTATVIVQNINNGDIAETLVLNNNGSGTFAGSIATAFGTSGDGVKDGIVAVKGGETVRVTYNDSANSSGGARDVTADTRVDSRRQAAAFCNTGTNTSAPTWRVDYFATKDLSGTVAVIAEEQHLNVNWQETAPFRQLPVDGWSARWTTSVTFTQGGKYRFNVGADDGVRFYVDDAIYVDDWSSSPYNVTTIDIGMSPGTHNFKVEFFEDSGDARLLVDCHFLESAVAVINPDGSVGSAFPSDTNFGAAIAHITTGRINVRANPSVQAAWIDYVYIYQRYPILGITEDGAWYLIDLKDGRTGWVAARYVRRYEETPVQIYPVWSGSEAALPNVVVEGYATTEIKLRSAPRTGAELNIVPPNVGFTVLARTQSGAWYKIEWEGVQGWVFAPYVVLTSGTVRDLPRE